MTIEAKVKELGRELHRTAEDMERSHSDDHATQQAHFAAAAAIRAVADTIGQVLIGTEDFREDETS